jgi:hypothetical protein
MACGCGTSSTSSKSGGKQDSNAMVWDDGSLAGGARLTITNTARKLSLAAIRVPNILVFNENPCLAIGDSLILNNLDLATCMKGLATCLTTTATAVAVGSTYELATNGSWTSLSGSPTLSFGSTSSSIFCGTGEAPKTMDVSVCNTPYIASSFSGSVWSRPANSQAMSGAAFVLSGSSRITTKSDFRPQAGDKIELSDTAINGANAATVLYISSGRNSANEYVNLVTLDRAVTGVTKAPAAGQNSPCVDATARPGIVAPLRFEASCGCKISAILDSSYSSSPNFPMGKLVDDGGCQRQEYCFTFVDATPGVQISNYKGQLIL